MSSIISEIKQSFKHGNMLTKLIYANVFIFLAVKILEVLSYLTRFDVLNPLLSRLMLPAHLPTLLLQPWSLFTYMVLHQGFLHILFNLLWLYWIGLIFIDFLNEKRFLAVYILGGLSGAALYLLAYNIFPVFSPSEMNPHYLLGASGSVMAIVLAITMYVPDYTLYLVLIGPVRLKWISLFCIVFDIITFNDGNPGGHIAHWGGALFGIYWGYRLKNGTDITKWLTGDKGTFATLFKKKPAVKVHYRNENATTATSTSQASPAEKKSLDSILDKIAKSGYDSLSKEEKEQLFRESKNM